MTLMAGQTVTVLRGYSARAFALGDGEPVGTDYGEFDRTGRVTRLVSLPTGARLVTLTSERSGMAYARLEDEGRPWAVLLIPGSYVA